ncbi:unnamed protein product [Ceutorhynchus assimilis]|uniref:FLYWCH-type domain-containing protein n=1 Tax=Ceutorhynchus assimilis TaxID=467358 RepID=A0A9N9MQQ6_9CUCU|nr:unnamed protein product [Ceutorhynchus assimilis]
MLSKKGHPLMVFENYKFRKYRVLKTTQEEVWCCTRKNCNAKMYILNSFFSRKSLKHNHQMEETSLIRQKISNSLKRKAEEICSERPLKLIRRELKAQSSSIIDVISMKDIQYIRNNLYRARLQQRQKLLKSPEELQSALVQMDINTSKGEPFLLINDMEINKRRRTNIDSYEDDSTSDSSKLIEMARDDRGASRYLQCQSDENMSDSDSVIDIIKHEIDIPEYVPDNGSLQEAETIMIKDDDDDDSSQSTHNIEEVNIKEEPISEQNNFDDRHPVDVFCKSVALSLKSLRMDLCNEGKIRIMQLISELEQRNSLPNEGPSTSKSLNNRAEPTSTVTNYLVPKKELD